MKVSLNYIAVLCLTTSILAGCVSTVKKQNRQDVVTMSSKLRAASVDKGSLQSTFVTFDDSLGLNFSPIGNASAFLDDKTDGYTPTAMTVDCESSGTHTSTECFTASCVTNTSNVCVVAGGKVELCGSIGDIK
ncbi:hypothetical protein N9M10_01570 [Hellea sp.]|nr:hypothetical protein [Hellea sp.]